MLPPIRPRNWYTLPVKCTSWYMGMPPNSRNPKHVPAEPGYFCLGTTTTPKSSMHHYYAPRKSEYGAAFLNTKRAVPLQGTLMDLGMPPRPTLMCSLIKVLPGPTVTSTRESSGHVFIDVFFDEYFHDLTTILLIQKLMLC